MRFGFVVSYYSSVCTYKKCGNKLNIHWRALEDIRFDIKQFPFWRKPIKLSDLL